MADSHPAPVDTSTTARPALSRAERFELPERIRLLVIFGGQSAEHAISCITAAHAIAAIDRDRYDVTAIGITRSGQWVDATAQLNAGSIAAAEIAPLEASGPVSTALQPIGEVPAGAPTVALVLLHGPNGEDGTIQGFLELAGIPYVGAGVLGSSVSMDKAAAKEIAAFADIPQADWVGLHERDVTAAALDDATLRLGLPIFVKPANLGSSVGISKAKTRDGLAEAVAEALRFDETVVLEEAIDGREIEIAALGNEDVRFSVPGEVIPAGEFYDFDDKYVDGSAQLVIPADLSDEQVESLRELALRSFRALRVQDFARCDFFWDRVGERWLLNEINTIPGFTPISMYPRLWQASGLEYGALIDELIRLALERDAHRGPRRR